MGVGDLVVSSFPISVNILEDQFNVIVTNEGINGKILDITIHKTTTKGNISNYDIILTHDDTAAFFQPLCSVFTIDIDAGASPLENFPVGTTIGELPIQKIEAFRVKNTRRITTYTILVISGIIPI